MYFEQPHNFSIYPLPWIKRFFLEVFNIFYIGPEKEDNTHVKSCRISSVLLQQTLLQALQAIDSFKFFRLLSETGESEETGESGVYLDS